MTLRIGIVIVCELVRAVIGVSCMQTVEVDRGGLVTAGVERDLGAVGQGVGVTAARPFFTSVENSPGGSV